MKFLLAEVFEISRNSILKELWVVSDSLFECTSFKMLNMTKVNLELTSDADVLLLLGMRGKLLTFPRDIVKSTTSIWNLMNQNKNRNILYSWVQIMYIVMQYPSFS